MEISHDQGYVTHLSHAWQVFDRHFGGLGHYLVLSILSQIPT